MKGKKPQTELKSAPKDTDARNRTKWLLGTGLDRPWGFQEVGAPRFQDNRVHEGRVVTPTHRPPLPPGSIPGNSFLLEAESTPGP